jgi:hypothetical protein
MDQSGEDTCLALSCLVLPCLLLCRVLSYLVLSCLVLSFLSCLVVSWLVLSCVVLSCVLSCLILSYLVWVWLGLAWLGLLFLGLPACDVATHPCKVSHELKSKNLDESSFRYLGISIDGVLVRILFVCLSFRPKVRLMLSLSFRRCPCPSLFLACTSPLSLSLFFLCPVLSSLVPHPTVRFRVTVRVKVRVRVCALLFMPMCSLQDYSHPNPYPSLNS